MTIDLPLGAVVGNGKCVNGRAMDLTRRREIFPAEPDAIVASATGLFQGTYYQWGGITPWGADCSGMVQTVFGLHGVKLLRDAWQQATQGVLVDGGLDGFEAGDLLFFSDRDDGKITHVALYAFFIVMPILASSWSSPAAAAHVPAGVNVPTWSS